MPKLTVAAGATGFIPARTFNGLSATRKALILNLVSGDAYIGWPLEDGSNTVTAAGATDAGISLAIAVPLTMSSECFDFSKRLNVFSVAGCVINYIENLI